MSMHAISRWIVLASCVTATHALAQDAAPATTPTTAPQARKWLACENMWAWFGSQCAGLKDAWHEGDPTLYLSGYTWHDPHTYTQEKLEDFNDRAWGGGYGWSKAAANGDNFGWYALIFRDSHFQYTKAVGWSWITYWPERSDFAVGLGYTAFLASRPDIASNWPFPAALPLASIKYKGFEVLGTFIPKLNAGINHGDVAYFFARYRF
jgi:lipid IVA palmitoyltransferase